MTQVARARAEAAQLLASDPGVSAFVGASAGSGKTKLLTDRLLRLMLAGADPGRIQCLTFTKAAAAEMALRLQRVLGDWVTLDDAALDARLDALHVAPGATTRRKARALFAEVLDLPGGMRIGTIHAFCQSLLRRFPLEAALSPHFSLVDDVDAAIRLREALEAMLTEAHTAVRRAALEELAGLVDLARFGAIVKALMGDARLADALAGGMDALAAAQLRALGADGDDAAVLADAIRWPGELRFAAVLRDVARAGSPSVVARAERLLEWLSVPVEDRVEHWESWAEEFLTGAGLPRAASVFVNKKLADARPELAEAFAAEQARVLGVIEQRRALRVAAASAALVRLAAPVVAAYAAQKEASAQLDYDDLIGRTSRLLVDPGAAWVLYKLDGGLDHLLLDEVQDTAPAQWDIAGALTAEFFVGEGAKAGVRTVFAVGDRKQSIYSFQGADPAQFDRWRGIMGTRVRAAGGDWREVALDVSFRSTAPVLALVDAVFAAPDAAAGVVDGGALTHLADRALHAGRVELWPTVPVATLADPEPWTVPERNLGAAGAPERLAEGLAGWIAAACGREALASKGRMLAPGDILILVRRRNAFARALVRALKARGVPVAGLDRMVLTEQPAVADLLALCDALLLPEDDLSLACVLTSPLGGLSDDSLMALAAGRRGTLWEALRRRGEERAEWSAARGFLATLLARVDYAAPHALLSEALGALGGRARLFARLGPEAAEPVDELLNAALRHAASHPPSLQGFVQWLRQSGAEVKREAEGAGSVVRIMTVHGAKGLQAPVVILPDTTSVSMEPEALVWAEDPAGGPAVPLWAPRKELRCAAVDALRAAAQGARVAEYNRLLYVALTRAEDRLIVCGWDSPKARPDGSWYDLVRRGFERLGATAAAFEGAWPGELLVHETPQLAVPEAGRRSEIAAAAVLPGWAGAAPAWRAGAIPDEPDLPSPLAPSRPENAGLGTLPAAASPLAEREAGGQRFLRGQFIHALLQHLPALPRDGWAAAATRFLARPGHGLAVDDVARTVAEVLAVLDDAALAPLFGPHGRAEVPLTGVVAGQVIGGVVDRLAVLPDRVLIADYKTNRAAPATPERVPLLYLRQMAAYRAVLRGVFPGREVLCALVWTSGARVMPLPEALLDRHAPGAEAAGLIAGGSDIS